jgi:hypothetical protein
MRHAAKVNLSAQQQLPFTEQKRHYFETKTTRGAGAHLQRKAVRAPHAACIVFKQQQVHFVLCKTLACPLQHQRIKAFSVNLQQEQPL